MGKWLIGCGALLLIVVGLLVALGFVVWGEVGKIGEAFTESQETLEAVEKSHPFTLPEGKILDEQRVAVFLDGRERLRVYLEEVEESMKGGSIFTKVRKGVGMVQNASPEFAAMLQEIAMSPFEYAWIANEISYVTQYSKRDEVLAEFPQMARLQGASRPKPKSGDDDDFFAQMQTQGDAGGGGWQAISQIDPYRLTVPRRNLEIVAAQVDRIVETQGALGFEMFFVPMYSVRLSTEAAAEEVEAEPADEPVEAESTEGG